MSTTFKAHVRLHRPQFNSWVVAAVVFAVAFAGLGIYVLVDRETRTKEGVASSDVAAMLDQRIAAMNSGDISAAAAFYAGSAVMEERDQVPAFVSSGRGEINSRLRDLYAAGLRIESIGPTIQMGRYVGEAVRFHEAGGTGTGEGVLVFELNQSGKIAHQWVMGETRD